MACRRFLVTTLVCALACLCSSCGPRMRQQISIKPYSRQMPAMPTGSVPTTGRLRTLTASATPLLTKKGPHPSPLLTKEGQGVVANGRIYYSYYCLMCHGARGDGNGPVGQSYVPKPTDLSSNAVTKLTDGELYAKMLHGVGHDPVMDQTVPLARRRQIVAYVRSLAGRRRGVLAHPYAGKQ